MVTLYSTGCPICEVLVEKLKSKNIDFIIFEDIVAMRKKGITTVPMLEVDGKLLNTKEAMEWVNNVN
jgi:hypothetical protein